MGAWAIWGACIVGLLAFGMLKLIFFDRALNRQAFAAARNKQGDQQAPKSAAEQARDERTTALRQRVSDGLGLAQLAIFVPVCMLMPALPLPGLFDYVQTPPVVMLVAALFALGIELEVGSLFYRTIGRIRLRGWLAEALRLGLALLGALIVITLPEELGGVRAALIGNFIFCGGLTLQRELRRRVRTGDDIVFSPLDSLLVATQLVIMLNLAAVALTIPALMILWMTDLMGSQKPLPVSLTLLAWLWTFVSVGYTVLYGLRLVVGARGFSWVDPPSWRVAIPHLRYKFRWGGFLMLGQIWLGCTMLAVLLLAMFGLGSLHARDWPAPGLGAALLIAIALLYACRPAEARGLAWLLPGHWGAAFARAWSLGFSPPLADIVRMTYLRAIFPGGSDDELLATIAEAARVRPQAGRSPRFAVIGDPGEGDDSQLYPANIQRGAAKRMACDSIAQRSSRQPGDTPAPGAGPIDFILISSDVIYPGGEMADYERAFYRPYAPVPNGGAEVPVYAIPGNHDWYDSLRGFLANFTFSASQGGLGASSLRKMLWDWRPWRRLDRKRVRQLRDRYSMHQIGGRADRPETHQRLSFFEMDFADKPLKIFALDNGVTGSIDALQFRWLAGRLAEARAVPAAEQPFILVLVGNPLYVGGEFAGEREAPVGPGDGQESRSERELYELLRAHEVDVVMGGDTHAYQRYEVHYRNQAGQARTMHHIVNGGGGAYLSPPMDTGWHDFSRDAVAPLCLSRRGVYHPARWDADNATDDRADTVFLRDVFPTASEMYDKFVWQARAQQPASGWRARVSAAIRQRYVELALGFGFTNALNHDEDRLLQSYVQIELTQAQGAWKLVIIPCMQEPAQPGEHPAVRPYTERRLTLTRDAPVLRFRELPSGVVQR